MTNETGPFRLPSGGLVDRTRALPFTFDGRSMSGFAGDTVASALLANGVRIVGRSLKSHRPRGILSAGVEEPNAVVSIEDRDSYEPLVRATEIPLRAGMEVRSLNAWPSAERDLLGALGALAPFTTAGFYYKTFMWPSWRFYERFI